MSLRICCKNIVKILWIYHFPFLNPSTPKIIGEKMNKVVAKVQAMGQ